jgi:NAD(P)-dependent dehydrogenase (short-subunit alcohol dehydrogenase family)
MSLNPRFDNWTGRVVWLVGASTGIGRATAARLHAAGARVVISARTQAALDSFTAALIGSLLYSLCGVVIDTAMERFFRRGD